MNLTRRSAFAAAASAAAVTAAPMDGWAEGRPSILHRNGRYPVTAAWHDENTKPFPFLADLSRDDLQKVLMGLLRKSDQSISQQLGGLTAEEVKALPAHIRDRVMGSSLSPHERALVQASNNHFNVRTAVDFLAGRPISDFGFEGVDQVHGNRHEFKCGCKLHIVFDHHRRFEDWQPGSNERRHHPHYPHTVCDLHAEHRDNLDRLHDAVHEHNRRLHANDQAEQERT